MEETGGEIKRFVAPAEGVERIDVWLVQMCASESETFSRNRIQGLIDRGSVTADGETVLKPSQRLVPNTVVEIRIPAPVPPIPEPENIPLNILYEDADLIVLDKPVGLVVHPAPGHDTGTLVNALLHHCPDLSGIGGVARPGLVHRLDKDTSGVMVVAKSQAAMQSLGQAFATHSRLSKVYLAVVHGTPVPAEGRIENQIARKPSNRKKMAVVEENGKVAITNYRVVPGGVRPSFVQQLSLVECRIETGRTHQIRVHMSSLGHPIAGDATYGKGGLDRQLNPPPTRQLLHAWRLELTHPVTRETMTFVAPIPADLAQYIDPDAICRP